MPQTERLWDGNRHVGKKGGVSSGRAYAPPCQSILLFKLQVYGHWFRYTHYSKQRLDQLVK